MILATSISKSIILVIGILLVVTLLLILMLLFVKEKLSPSGPVKININGKREIEVNSGDSFAAAENCSYTVCIIKKLTLAQVSLIL